MSNEYTITVTIRDTEKGVHVQSRGELGDADSVASVVAHSLGAAIKRETRRVKAAVEAGLATESSTTIH